MKLSTETYVMRERFGDKRAIEMIKNAGYDCYDYSFYWTSENTDMLGDDYKERAVELKSFSDKIGICCNQAHAPFEFNYNDEMNMSNKAYKRLIRSLETASVLGAKTIIVHAISDLPEEVDFYEYNRKFYNSLAPYCGKFGIQVSVENLYVPKDGNWEHYNWRGVLTDPKEHIDFVKSLDGDCFNICIDVGHSSITGYKPEDVIAAMDKNMLKALHIHDNDYVWDLHYIPLFGKMDWNKIMESLKKIGYDGDLTFEIMGSLEKMDNELLEPALCFAEKIGRNIIKK